MADKQFVARNGIISLDDVTVSGSITATGGINISGSIASASYAATSSYADNFKVGDTLTVQTIVAQVITSSTEYITGSTIFGSSLSNTHQFTGTVS